MKNEEGCFVFEIHPMKGGVRPKNFSGISACNKFTRQ
jgi:hypothetical protein